MKTLLVLIVLAGCATVAPPAHVATTCPPAAPAPSPLPPVRTIERVLAWAKAEDVARQKTVLALHECERRLSTITGER